MKNIHQEVSLLTFKDYPVYDKSDLGLQYTKQASSFKIWAPSASEAVLNLYESDTSPNPIKKVSLKITNAGIWSATIKGDLKDQYYTFQTKVNGTWGREVPDPYVKAVGVNGKRGQVIDFKETNPTNWEKDVRPPLASFLDIIIYELHVRDLSMHPNSGIQNKGKFLGIAEGGTTSPDGLATGLDHIKELGVTHVHLLPSYDFLSVDESRPEDNEFNWGYDPQNYNVPEGSYSSNPSDGTVRIKEFKQMVKTLHDNGLRVILDVVYNHTGATEESNFNQLVPGYYYRQNEAGGFSDASACGNETASERAMMRKFIRESVKYWVEEYHIDGFRFDLMGIHDIETMKQVAATVQAIDPSIFVYGEGWTGGDSPLPEEQKALKKHTLRIPGVAAFSDDMRDAVKGHVFTPTDKGFASGKLGMEESVKFGIVASTQHPQVDYDKVNYSNAPWAAQPTQTINYVSCHDNHTLWDRLLNSQPDISEEERIKMHLLANTIVLTAQGIPFLHAGVDMLRTKNGEENSYKSPDLINRLDWSRKTKYKQVFDYYKSLIQLRKNHPAFRLTSTEMIQRHLSFIDFEEDGLIGYSISGKANDDNWEDIIVLFNGNQTSKKISLPDGVWSIALQDYIIDERGLGQVSEEVEIKASSAMILFSSTR